MQCSYINPFNISYFSLLQHRFCLLNSSYYLISTSAIQSFSDMVYKWSVVFGDRSFEKGWDEYCHENVTNKHDMLLLRHIGHLIFDVIHFSELQKQIYLSWRVSLPNLLQAGGDHAQGPFMLRFISCSYL